MFLKKMARRLIENQRKVKLIGLVSLFKIKYPSLSSGKYMELRMPIVQNKVLLRNQSIDAGVFRYVFYDQYHKPIPEVSLGRNPVIVDLGANIGLSILTFNHWYPGAQIIGYEMDAENYTLAKQNTSSLNNLTLINKAVHHTTTTVHYDKYGREDGYSIGPSAGQLEANSVKAVSISDVLLENGLTRINYLKMDIEGAEIKILNNSDLSWLKHVDNLDIEFHLEAADDLGKYVEILEREGFATYVKKDHWSCVTAIKLK